jgi:hypothetical protein
LAINSVLRAAIVAARCVAIEGKAQAMDTHDRQQVAVRKMRELETQYSGDELKKRFVEWMDREGPGSILTDKEVDDLLRNLG